MRTPLQVLVVDDDRAIAHSIADALKLRGHFVSTSESSAGALSRAVPDVLVTDLHLGATNGLDLIRELKRRGRAPRSIMISGDPSFSVCREAMRLGVVEFLSKPFELQELVDAVEEPPSIARSPGQPGRYERTYRSEPAAAERAAKDLVAFALRCGVGPASRARLGSACAELVDNAARHAYPVDPGPVRVSAELDPRDLVLVVRDEGIGFDAMDAGLDRIHHALDGGFARASALSENIRIDSQPGWGTQVQLRFSVYRADFDEAHVDLSELDFFTPQTARKVLEAVQRRGSGDLFHLSPALAVTVGRLLVGPDSDRVLQAALWS